MKKIAIIFLLLAFVFILPYCLDITLANAPQPIQPAVSAEHPPAEQPASIIVSVVGDIMMHNTQIQAGYRAADGSYDFSPYFARIKPLLAASDLVIGNLETTLAGEKRGYSGYPHFNTPEILAPNLLDAGFHILTTANNHCLDMGQAGLETTLEHLDNTGLLHTGTFRTHEERDKILTVDRKGAKLAILSYTFSTNGIKPAKGKDFSVNYLDPALIEKDLARARDAGAQLVLVFLHFGQEYQARPNSQQTQLVEALFSWGADIVLGYHPHVLQPATFIRGEGNPPKNKFVIYSLGNFISDQSGLERQSSIILNLHIKADPACGACLEKATYIPIWTRRYRSEGRTSFEVLPLEPAINSIKRGISPFSPWEQAMIDKAWNHITSHLGSQEEDFRLQTLPVPLEGLNLLKQ